MGLVTLDFETYFDKGYTITSMSNNEYITDDRFHIHGVGIKEDEQATVWYSNGDMAAKLHSISWATTELVCHNTMFDGMILQRSFGIVPKIYRDTLCMAKGTTPHAENKLGVLAQRYQLGIKGDGLKDLMGVKELSPKEHVNLAIYCINDVDLTHRLYKMFLQHYPPGELEVIDITLRMALDPKLMFDTTVLEAVYDEEVAMTQHMISKSGVTRSVLASRKQFVELLGNKGIKVHYKVGKSKKNPGQLIPALAKSDAGFQRLYVEYPEHKELFDARLRVSSRIQETRAARLLKLAELGAVGVPLNYYGGHTGRWSGTEGVNFQNFTPRIKKAISPPAGHILYDGDLKQIEVRVLAVLAGVDSMLSSFREERDIYSEFASEKLYHRPVAKDSQERFIGKRAILGLGYNMGSEAFYNDLSNQGIVVTEEYVQTVVDAYRTTYSEIKNLWRHMQNILPYMADGTLAPTKTRIGGIPLEFGHEYIILPNGMRLSYPHLGIDEHEGGFQYQAKSGSTKLYGGKLVENITQALARIIIAGMMRELRLKLEPLGGYIVGMVHDSIWVIAPEAHNLAVSTIINEVMTKSPSWIPTIPLAVDLSHGAA